MQTVGKGVVHIWRPGEAIEHNFRRTVWHTIPVPIRDKEKLRRAHHPHSAIPPLNALKLLKLISKHPARIKPAVPILVLENEDAIPQVEIEFPGGFGVGIVFRDPQPATRIPCHRDGVLHIRLGGKHAGFETRRQPHLCRSLTGRHWRSWGRARSYTAVEIRRRSRSRRPAPTAAS